MICLYSAEKEICQCPILNTNNRHLADAPLFFSLHTTFNLKYIKVKSRELWSITIKPCRLTKEPLRLTLELWRLTMEPRWVCTCRSMAPDAKSLWWGAGPDSHQSEKSDVLSSVLGANTVLSALLRITVIGSVFSSIRCPAVDLHIMQPNYRIRTAEMPQTVKYILFFETFSFLYINFRW